MAKPDAKSTAKKPNILIAAAWVRFRRPLARLTWGANLRCRPDS